MDVHRYFAQSDVYVAEVKFVFVQEEQLCSPLVQISGIDHWCLLNLNEISIN